MFKTLPLGSFLAAVIAVSGPSVFAAEDHTLEPGVQAVDVRPDAPDYAVAAPTAAARTAGVYGDSSADSGALPLAQFARADIKPQMSHAPTGFRALVARVRDGGLPEPASWALMLIGFGMIGGALRGFIVANRRLAGLQPEDTE
jgi:hypothetical protein